ncbi:response regulator [Halobellus marinus]|jgi:DNA-binding response OmpR family regulator|uniref:response regulator n=1 Tax=Halobellus TaxID=1073986 RepID=UPI0028B1A4B1|nr:response regulator [Halobellus sp. DFY28]
MGTTGGETTILAVDDEPALREIYAMFLEEVYEVRIAAGGEAALSTMDDDVDVVLLDRRMPRMSGSEVLDTLRERGYTVPVMMVTAVDPQEDIITMPFDDYLVKPIDREELLAKIDVLASQAHLDRKSREFYRLASKRATLETQDSFDHTASEEYQELVDRMEALRSELNETLDDLIEEEPRAAFQSL